MPIDQELLDILACPKCKGDLTLTESQDGLVCNACALKYQIKDDIPIMLIDEAEKIKVNIAAPAKKTTPPKKASPKKGPAKKAAPKKAAAKKTTGAKSAAKKKK